MSGASCVKDQIRAFVHVVETHDRCSDTAHYVAALKGIASILADGIPADETEYTVFSHLTLPISKHFPALLDQINEELKSDCDDCSEVLRRLEEAVATIECMHSLAKAVSWDTITFEAVRGMLPTLLDLARDSYSHLKNSEVVYGRHYSQLEGSLRKLSECTVHLQFALLSAVEKVKLDNDKEDDITWLVKTCDSLQNLGCVLEGTEIKMLLSARKLLVRLLLQYCSALKNKLNIDTTVGNLCSYLTDWILKLRNSQWANEAGFAVELRVATFHTKLVISVFDRYQGYYDSSAQDVIRLALLLAGVPIVVANSSTLIEAQKSAVIEQLWPAADHVVAQNLHNEDFCCAITNLDVPSESWGCYIFLLVTILDKLMDAEDETYDTYMKLSCGENIFSKVFFALEKCWKELQLPALINSAQSSCERPSRDTDLLEHAHACICRFIATLPARHLPAVETILLRNVLHVNNTRAFLATEVWCWLGRYCPPQLCFDHAVVLVRVAQATSGIHYQNVKHLLKRLVACLAEEYKDRLRQMFINPGDLLVSSILPLPQRTEEMWAEALALLNELNSKEIDASGLSRLDSLVSHLKDCITSKKEPLPLKLLLQVLGRLPIIDTPQCSSLMEGLICLVTTQIHVSSNRDLLQILNTLEYMVRKDVHFVHTLVVLSLSKWSNVPVARGPQEREVLNKLSGLFAQALLSNNFVIQHITLLVFTEFARTTQHDIVISKAAGNVQIKQLVTNFMTKADLRKPIDLLALLMKQEKILLESRHAASKPESSSSSKRHLTNGTSTVDSVVTRSNKRAKYEAEAPVDNCTAVLRQHVGILLDQDKAALQPHKACLSDIYSQLGTLLHRL
ncbi:FIGNL1-interacting regulator of recombination and mitosis-like [Ornithodoros turicata]|uniref:FIGNL1-interacting regulator of recombination and mitosis-like n=1 Tax=Ornithodoros turicata TaxID=34597 RepID=UPI0031395C31